VFASIDTLVAVFVALFVLAVVLPGLVVGYVLVRYLQLPAALSLVTGPVGVGRRAGGLAAGLFCAGFFGVGIAAGGLPDGGRLYEAGVVVSLVGAGGVALGVGNFRRYLAIRAGGVDSGRALPSAEGAVPAPFSGRDCVAWAVRVREHTSVNTRGPTPPIYAAMGGPKFRVAGDIEVHRVDAATADLRLWPVGSRGVDQWQAPADAPDTVPERIRTFLAERALPDQRRRRVYDETRLEAGDAVTLLRTARVMPFGDRLTPTVVPTPEATVRRSTRRRVAAGVVGLVAMCGGLLAVAVAAGLG
jgi:hypothetical protein